MNALILTLALVAAPAQSPDLAPDNPNWRPSSHVLVAFADKPAPVVVQPTVAAPAPVVVTTPAPPSVVLPVTPAPVVASPQKAPVATVAVPASPSGGSAVPAIPVTPVPAPPAAPAGQAAQLAIAGPSTVTLGTIGLFTVPGATTVAWEVFGVATGSKYPTNDDQLTFTGLKGKYTIVAGVIVNGRVVFLTQAVEVTESKS